ncbi:MAG: sigma-54-dependent Fis family transcriptional regulator [Deltaproteobacteria bacterium]|nr:sigma-54-dependent Fis family transcriptional regulator [Deltaproteobacteria bacterium]MBW2220410.1 sigma-54-dependent Fis family transcriptional regulator [Deltaproteobacteria bacterium]
MQKPDNKHSVLVVDDELSMREFLNVLLSKVGYHVETAETGAIAMSMLEENPYDLLLCDIRLGDTSGIDVLKKAKSLHHEIVAIMISAYSTTKDAVEAMNQGAYDYVPKPFDNNELKMTISNALNLKTIEHEKERLDDELKKNLHFGKLIGNSPQMMKIYKLIKQVAKTKTNILVTGESGTGKEFIASAIHEQSNRKDNPFVVVNCGGIPENLMESELFGHKKGAFTGATHEKKGLFEIAHKGTIFLDEIGELSIPLQVKLLRAVQERVFKPVGGTKDVEVDIRIISATNKNLEEEIIAGNFREDLFYRLNVIEIKVPPLRERKTDLKALCRFFLEKYATEMDREITKISSYAVELLMKYDFPGNVRELENLIERSVALSTTNIILPESLAISIHKRRWIEGIANKRFDLDEVTNGVSLESVLEEIEAAYIKKAMELSNGNKNRAAELLDLSLRSVRYRIDKLGIEK